MKKNLKIFGVLFILTMIVLCVLIPKSPFWIVFFLSTIISTAICIFYSLYSNTKRGKLIDSFFKDDDIEDLVEPEKPEEQTQVFQAKEALLDLQEYINLNFASESVKGKVEPLLDRILKILFVVNNELPSNQITYQLNNLCIEHLPERVKAYLGMDQDNRIDRKQEFFDDIDKMSVFVEQVADVLENTKLTLDQKQDVLSDIKFGTLA